MTEMLEIRDSVRADFGAIELLYPDAFPDEDLLPLVRNLLPGELSVPEQWRQPSLWIS